MLTITLDTGAMIALERNEKRMRQLLVDVQHRRVLLALPTAALVEWWRAEARQQRILDTGIEIVPLSMRIAKNAGEAIKVVKATPIDAIVMATAALRGDFVFTSDLKDLEALQTVFPTVRLFRATGR